MIRSFALTTKTTPTGGAAAAHRSGILGKKLAFASGAGPDVIRENNLMDVSREINLDKPSSLETCLRNHGPLIASGKFGGTPLSPNISGHAIVISGCDAVKETIQPGLRVERCQILGIRSQSTLFCGLLLYRFLFGFASLDLIVR